MLEEFSGQRADSRGSLGLGLGPSSPSSPSSSSSPPAALGSPQRWDALMDTDLELGGERTTLKRALLPRLLQPQLDKQAALARALTPQSASSALQTLTSCPPIYSLILFGPPGTAKTTICSAVASFLGWHFVTIDTACFLADGLEHVASRMSYIFDRLKALDRTIILFDEIEEFCLGEWGWCVRVWVEREMTTVPSYLLTIPLIMYPYTPTMPLDRMIISQHPPLRPPPPRPREPCAGHGEPAAHHGHPHATQRATVRPRGVYLCVYLCI